MTPEVLRLKLEYYLKHGLQGSIYAYRWANPMKAYRLVNPWSK